MELRIRSLTPYLSPKNDKAAKTITTAPTMYTMLDMRVSCIWVKRPNRLRKASHESRVHSLLVSAPTVCTLSNMNANRFVRFSPEQLKFTHWQPAFHAAGIAVARRIIHQSPKTIGHDVGLTRSPCCSLGVEFRASSAPTNESPSWISGSTS